MTIDQPESANDTVAYSKATPTISTSCFGNSWVSYAAYPSPTAQAFWRLTIMQHVVAIAMWKYELTVGEPLRGFARQFDRLDVPAERRRLYDIAQEPLPSMQ